MNSFRYPNPESSSSRSTWSDLSDEAQAALASVAMGPISADRLLPKPNNQERRQRPDLEPWEEWAKGELESEHGGIQAWRKYQTTLSSKLPTSLDELVGKEPRIAEKLARLYQERQALIASGELTPDNGNIGKAMHLVLIPWREMHNNLGNFEGWVGRLRGIQGAGSKLYDYMAGELCTALTLDDPFYRQPGRPERLLNAYDYLDYRMQDGPWGIALIQTSPRAGIRRFGSIDPDQLTDYGKRHVSLASSTAIDGLGCFEWTALILQENLIEAKWHASILLANRLPIGNEATSPWLLYGRNYPCRSSIDTYRPETYHLSSEQYILRPRLAIL